MNDQDDKDRCNAHPMLPGLPGRSIPTSRPDREFPARYVIRSPPRLRLLLPCLQRPRTKTRPHFQGRRSLSRRSHTGGPTPFAFGASVLFLCISSLMNAGAGATVAPAKSTSAALGGFVKDRALARVLGETLFR